MFTPQYVTDPSWVISWLSGRVQFGSNANTEITPTFLNMLICYAESEVSRRLNRFYALPFQTTDGQAFTSLPIDTQQYLILLMVMKACILILKTDFGKTNANTSGDYEKDLNDEYWHTLNSNLSRGDDGRYKNPPLAGLALNPEYFTGITTMNAAVTENLIGSLNMDYALNQTTKTYANWWQFLPPGRGCGRFDYAY